MSTVPAAAQFRPASLMKEADRLTGETRGLALRQPDPDETPSCPIVQQALALLSLLVSAKAIAFAEVMAQGLVTAMAQALALLSLLVSASQLEFGLELVSGSALKPAFA